MAKILPIADSLRSIVFRRFVELVASDPEFDRIGVNIRSWQGNPDDHQPPSQGQLPWMRLGPDGGVQRWSASGELSIPFLIRVEIVTEGYDVEDGMNLWESLETLVISPEFQDAMREAGATQVTPTEAAFGVKPHHMKWEPVIEGCLYSVGMIEVEMFRQA